jgi:flagellin-like protein
MVLKQKQGISPVVATALLLVVAVVAVVGFQTWFQSFQSDTLAKSSQAGAAGSAFNFQLLENDTLYVTNSDPNLITTTLTYTVEGCSEGTHVIVDGLNQVNLSGDSCASMASGSSKSILLKTTSGVYPFTGVVQ